MSTSRSPGFGLQLVEASLVRVECSRDLYKHITKCVSAILN